MQHDYTHFNQFILAHFLNAYVMENKAPKKLSQEQKLKYFVTANQDLQVYPRPSLSFLNRLVIKMTEIGFKDPLGFLDKILKDYYALPYVDLFAVRVSKDFLSQAQNDFWMSV